MIPVQAVAQNRRLQYKTHTARLASMLFNPFDRSTGLHLAVRRRVVGSRLGVTALLRGRSLNCDETKLDRHREWRAWRLGSGRISELLQLRP